MTIVGLLGGTFDPPHLGHLRIAQAVADSGLVEPVWFMPSVDPWQKVGQGVSSYDVRVEMLKALIGDHDFKISHIEKAIGRSETLQTLRALKERNPTDTFRPIIGADQLNSLPGWIGFADLVLEASFVVVNRYGVNPKVPPGLTYDLVTAPDVPISSSQIRARVAKGESISMLTSPDVIELITRKQLYLDRND